MKRFIAVMLTWMLVFGLSGCTTTMKAERAEEKNFIIDGEKYVAIPVGYTKEGKTVAKVDGYAISEIPEDKTHTFLAVRSGLDNWVVVKESYVIPTSGKLNVAYCAHERITDGEKRSMVQSILDEEHPDSFVVKSDVEEAIHNATKDIYVGYEDCPIGTDWIGSIGNINGHLVFVKAEDIKDRDRKYTCYILKEEYQDLYADSVHRTFETVKANG